MNDLYIWWVDQPALEHVVRHLSTMSVDTWLRSEILSADGRCGRGRLWVNERFKDVQRIDPWPETLLAKYFEDRCSGIVISPKELEVVAQLPGIVTDFQLKRI